MNELQEAESMLKLSIKKYIKALDKTLKRQEELEITESLYKKDMTSKSILMHAIKLRIACDKEVSECHQEWEYLNNKVKELRNQENKKLVKKP